MGDVTDPLSRHARRGVTEEHQAAFTAGRLPEHLGSGDHQDNPLPNQAVRRARSVPCQAWMRWRVRRRVITYAIYVLFDGIVTIGGFALALLLRFGGRVPPVYATRLPVVALALAALYIG